LDGDRGDIFVWGLGEVDVDIYLGMDLGIGTRYPNTSKQTKQNKTSKNITPNST